MTHPPRRSEREEPPWAYESAILLVSEVVLKITREPSADSTCAHVTMHRHWSVYFQGSLFL